MLFNNLFFNLQRTCFVRHLLMKVHNHICWSLLINLMITANHCTSGFTVLFEKFNFGVAIQKIQFGTSPGRLRHSLMRVHNHIYWPLGTTDQFADHCWSIWWSLLINLMITALQGLRYFLKYLIFELLLLKKINLPQARVVWDTCWWECTITFAES